MTTFDDASIYFSARSKRSKPKRSRTKAPTEPLIVHKRGPGSPFSHTKTLIAEDIGFLTRSSWERNVIRILKIFEIPFEFEPLVFRFPIKSGSAKGYCPDLRIRPSEGEYEFLEIKGWFDPRSALKIKRLRIHHPEEFKRLTLIIGKEKKSIEICQKLEVPKVLFYPELSHLYKSYIPNWEGT